MQFINYIIRVHSLQQFFFWAPTLFKIFSHIYICLDLYPETIGVANIEVWFSQHVLLMTIFIIEITEVILLAIFTTYHFKHTCSEAWPATLRSKNALKLWPCRVLSSPHAPCVLHSAHLCYRLFLENVIRLQRKVSFFWEILAVKKTTSRQKCAQPYFHIVTN